MTRSSVKFISLLAAVIYATCAFATAEASLCSQLSGYFSNNPSLMLTDPSRTPTEQERLLIDQSQLELLEITDYEKGVSIVDADNDGKDDVFVWNIQGSGRFVSTALFDMQPLRFGNTGKLIPKTSMDLGVLQSPRFIRFNGINYLIFSETGDKNAISVSRINKVVNGRYEHQILCRMQTVIKTETDCRHPACSQLKGTIENRNENGPFTSVEWPHKYFSPAGLAVYFDTDWQTGDFDNTGSPISIWHIGGEDRNPTLLGLGDQMPEVNSKLWPASDTGAKLHVLPGHQHDRLRQALTQQRRVLSSKLHRHIDLPGQGAFFLFTANQNRTYWAWDFGEPPFGEEIHITYTNAKKSDYIGMLRIKRNSVLETCTADCVMPLDQPIVK